MHVGKYRGVLDQKSASLSNDEVTSTRTQKSSTYNLADNNFARVSRFFGQTAKTLTELFQILSIFARAI